MRPSVGSWLSYGLGTENENLPSFVCVDYPTEHGGVRLYGNAFLPASHQGTQIKLTTTPERQPQIRYLESDYLKASRQREQVDVIAELSRKHNPHGYTVWLAGGGVKAGTSHGETDEFGYLAVENKVHMHDLHATVLHLMGLDHERLTYRYAGRDFRLTNVYGHIVQEVFA